jgi:hypothetical protein
MSVIWIRSPRSRDVPDGPAVDIACDRPFGEALATTLESFEVAYLRALLAEHGSLASAARHAGLDIDVLIGMIIHHGARGQTLAPPTDRHAA